MFYLRRVHRSKFHPTPRLKKRRKGTTKAAQAFKACFAVGANVVIVSGAIQA